MRLIGACAAMIALLYTACGSESDRVPEELYSVSCDAITCLDASETYTRGATEGCAWYCEVDEEAMRFLTYRIEADKDGEGCFNVTVDEIVPVGFAIFQNGTQTPCQDF